MHFVASMCLYVRAGVQEHGGWSFWLYQTCGEK